MLFKYAPDFASALRFGLSALVFPNYFGFSTLAKSAAYLQSIMLYLAEPEIDEVLLEKVREFINK